MGNMVTDVFPVPHVQYSLIFMLKIEQHPSFLKVLSPDEAEEYLNEEEELNKKREFWSS